MKKKITFALCALFLVAGFFGLCAVAESGLPLWEAVGLITAIFVAEIPVVKIANREI